jgi:hypothetical protein
LASYHPLLRLSRIGGVARRVSRSEDAGIVGIGRG